MNKNGSMYFYGFMLGLTIIILALALAPGVNDVTKIARGESTNTTLGLDCDNSSISNFDKATCTVSDLNIFYFVGMLIMIGGSVILAKIIF